VSNYLVRKAKGNTRSPYAIAQEKRKLREKRELPKADALNVRYLKLYGIS